MGTLLVKKEFDMTITQNDSPFRAPVTVQLDLNPSVLPVINGYDHPGKPRASMLASWSQCQKQKLDPAWRVPVVYLAVATTGPQLSFMSVLNWTPTFKREGGCK